MLLAAVYRDLGWQTCDLWLKQGGLMSQKERVERKVLYIKLGRGWLHWYCILSSVGNFFWPWKPVWLLPLESQENHLGPLSWRFFLKPLSYAMRGERRLGVNWSKDQSLSGFSLERREVQAFSCQLMEDHLEKSRNLKTLPHLLVMCELPLAPASCQNLSTFQVPECLPRTCLLVVSPHRDPVIDTAN